MAKKVSVSIADTENIMTDDKVVSFSKNVNINELKKYRTAIGINTREIIKGYNQWI